MILVDEITATNGIAAKLETGFLARIPMPMVADPENPGTMIPEFATTKDHLRADIIKRYLRIANQGHTLLAGATAEKMNDNDLS